MTVHFLGENSFLVKAKTAEIVLGRECRAGDLILAGPGEYESADIHIRGYPGAYLITVEDLNLLYVNNPGGLPDEVIEDIEEDIDVLLLAIDTDPAHLRHAVETMNDLDPKITIPALESQDHPFCKEVGHCPAPQPGCKISRKDLAEGERKLIILDAEPAVRP